MIRHTKVKNHGNVLLRLKIMENDNIKLKKIVNNELTQRKKAF